MRLGKTKAMHKSLRACAMGVFVALVSSFIFALPSFSHDPGSTPLTYPDGTVPSQIAVPSDLLTERYPSGADLSGLKKRPLLYWRYHAMQPQRPIRNSIFLLFFCFTINLIFRKRVALASESIKRRFWKSLGVGILCVFLFATTTRLCYEVELFEPLAELSMAVLQLLCLFGLAVSTRLVGQSILKKFNACQPEAGKDPIATQILLWTFLGILVLAMFSLLPPIHLPNGHSVAPIAPRIGLLFSVLGMGALIRTRLGRRQAE